MQSPFGKIGFLSLAAALSLPVFASPIRAQDDKPVTQKSAGNEPPPYDPKTA